MKIELDVTGKRLKQLIQMIINLPLKSILVVTIFEICSKQFQNDVVVEGCDAFLESIYQQCWNEAKQKISEIFQLFIIADEKFVIYV